MSINDMIKGRTDENTNALKFMLEGYEMDRDDLEKRKLASLTSIGKMLEKYPELYKSLSEESINNLMNGESPTATDLVKVGTNFRALAGTDTDLLSPNEAASLGLAYGTTKSKAAAMGIVPKSSGDLTQVQSADYRLVTTDYQKNEIIKQGSKAISLEQIADQVIANPNSATNQLKSLYILVKNLDPESAVREGELDLANKTQSYLDKFKTSLTRITQGQVISPAAARELALATKEIASVWTGAAKRETNKFRSQATGFGIGQQFDDYIKRIENLDSAGATKPSSEVTDDEIEQFKLKYPKYKNESNEAIRKELGFNSVGGDTNKAIDIKKLAKAIGQFESGGRYNAIGKDTGSGNRAYGRYQVMASNIPSWTREALGKSITKEQFLNDPQAQDQVAEYKMSQLLAKYGTAEDVASAWFSGRPLAKAGNAKDVLGTTVPKYVKNVMSIYNS
jgi:hypothetical protein